MSRVVASGTDEILCESTLGEYEAQEDPDAHGHCAAAGAERQMRSSRGVQGGGKNRCQIAAQPAALCPPPSWTASARPRLALVGRTDPGWRPVSWVQLAADGVTNPFPGGKSRVLTRPPGATRRAADAAGPTAQEGRAEGSSCMMFPSSKRRRGLDNCLATLAHVQTS